MRNFIFVSPHFPENYRHFCIQLREKGVNVLGIGDAPYDSLDPALREALTEYYRVDTMERYEDMYRAVAFFSFKYGKIDGLESNNEYWLEQDARLREDFNIPGLKPETLSSIKRKSGMKKYYAQAQVPCARFHLVTDLAESLAFIETVGYPVIAKPDNGVGAVNTFKLRNEEELRHFHEMDFGDTQFIMEEFVPGDVYSYDAIIDSKGQPLLETGNHTPGSIMDTVNDRKSCVFYIEKQIKKDLRDAGRRCLAAFGIRSRFIHFEFFRLAEDHAWLGKKGTVVGLEVNLRPSGGFTPDMINQACSTNVYRDWADMVTQDCLRPREETGKYYCVSVGLRDCRHYVHSPEEVRGQYMDRIVLETRLPEVLAQGMGETLYLARFAQKKEMDDFIRFVAQEEG
ncbi:MAG: ATP-grasp domain-containing protein [Eubacteriales bacterium]|nr:ATP-grasp domain-containing protein [Eubacteriales bacterium]